jgi:hypothetical protein
MRLILKVTLANGTAAVNGESGTHPQDATGVASWGQAQFASLR